MLMLIFTRAIKGAEEFNKTDLVIAIFPIRESCAVREYAQTHIQNTVKPVTHVVQIEHLLGFAWAHLNLT